MREDALRVTRWILKRGLELELTLPLPLAWKKIVAQTKAPVNGRGPQGSRARRPSWPGLPPSRRLMIQPRGSTKSSYVGSVEQHELLLILTPAWLPQPRLAVSSG
jgi:hypothetical protein